MMKLKNGFTLAEVLITLGIIGVVAAITLPTMMQDGKKQQLGTKLAKFQNQLENITRSAEVSGDDRHLDEILKENLLFTNGTPSTLSIDYGASFTELRDGTSVVFESGGLNPEFIDSEKFGSPMYTVYFRPNISGLNLQDEFAFTVTSKGFVLPSEADTCTQLLYQAKWKTSKVYNNTNCPSGKHPSGISS